MADKVSNTHFVLLDFMQWIHTREATILRHAMTGRAKVICNSQFIIFMCGGGVRLGASGGLDGGRTEGQMEVG